MKRVSVRVEGKQNRLHHNSREYNNNIAHNMVSMLLHYNASGWNRINVLLWWIIAAILYYIRLLGKKGECVLLILSIGLDNTAMVSRIQLTEVYALHIPRACRCWLQHYKNSWIFFMNIWALQGKIVHKIDHNWCWFHAVPELMTWDSDCAMDDRTASSNTFFGRTQQKMEWWVNQFFYHSLTM